MSVCLNWTGRLFHSSAPAAATHRSVSIAAAITVRPIIDYCCWHCYEWYCCCCCCCCCWYRLLTNRCIWTTALAEVCDLWALSGLKYVMQAVCQLRVTEKFWPLVEEKIQNSRLKYPFLLETVLAEISSSSRSTVFSSYNWERIVFSDELSTLRPAWLLKHAGLDTSRPTQNSASRWRTTEHSAAALNEFCRRRRTAELWSCTPRCLPA